LDLSRANQMSLRLVPFSEIRQIQMKGPRGRPRILAAVPALLYVAVMAARAF
jgi:hypothetical protein